MFVQPLLLALKCIPCAKYEKNPLIMPVSLLFFKTLDLVWSRFCPKTTPNFFSFFFFFYAGFQWNMLGNSININNFNCNPIVLKIFLLKSLKIAIFGVSMGHTQKKQRFFLQKWQKQKADHKLSKTFFYQNIICLDWVRPWYTWLTLKLFSGYQWIEWYKTFFTIKGDGIKVGIG